LLTACSILVTADYIKADEQLSVELWDSDRMSADDIVGKVELSLQTLLQHPGKMYPQVSKLMGLAEGSEMPGELRWEVGYFGKPRFRPALRTHGKDVNLPDNLKDDPNLQDDKGTLENAEEDAVAHTPPDPLWPSGICSVIVHQIVNLELTNIKGSKGNRKGREFEPAQETGEIKEEEGKSLPSAYATIMFNDQLVYRTRTKVVSSKPIFNAGTERFVRDWRSAIVTIAVRDQRMRQHDPILGVIPLKLSEILQSSSQVTRWYPLDGGVGFGRMRVSILFRSVETRLPENMLGWDVGTFEFTSDRIVALNYNKNAKLKMRTGGSSGSIARTQCRKLDGGDGMFWDLAKKDGKNSVRLPVKYRYRSPVVFEFHTAGTRKATAYAMVWLHHLVDNEETDINIPIWTTKNAARLTQNYITEDNFREASGLEDLQEVGRLQFRCQFHSGIDEDHEHFATDNDAREIFQVWEATRDEGVRPRTVTKEMPDEIQQLHEQSLLKGRDVLDQADPEEKKKWLSKDGEDWSGAFGEDPAVYVDRSGKKTREPSAAPRKSDATPSSDEDEGDMADDDSSVSSGDDEVTSHAPEPKNADGDADPTAVEGAKENGKGPVGSYKTFQQNKKGMERRQRGPYQWKPGE
jgi:C2 domain